MAFSAIITPTRLIIGHSIAPSRAAGPAHFRRKEIPALATAAAGSSASGGSAEKVVWLTTCSKDALTAGLEAGWDTVVFDEGQASLTKEWQQLGRFKALTRTKDGAIMDDAGNQVGRVRLLTSPDSLRAAEREAAAAAGVVVMDARDWQIIPAENLVAAYQHNPAATLLAAAPDCSTSRVMLEALEAGTDGVLLRTDSPEEVRRLASYLQQRRQHGGRALTYAVATVTTAAPLGMGDRACVDLCSLLGPGEGLLVGSFARALALVHSECAESRYIASRPFRVNAGPVHAYLLLPGGRTGYLSELRSGSEVLVADACGRTRTAVVGRVKIERRPLILVEAELPDGERCSLLLQNAETVRLVGPAASSPGSHTASAVVAGLEGGPAADGGYVWQHGGNGAAAPPTERDWRAVSVSELAPGDQVLVLRQQGARHTGVAVEEAITER